MPETMPFTPLEEMTHHLDETFQPWNMQGEIESTGTVDIERLEAATATAMEYHPLASARRRPSTLTDTRYEWILPDDPEPLDVIEVDSDEVPLEEVRNRIYGERFDLTEEAPVRICIYRGGGLDGGDRVLQSTSHVAGDGLGTLRYSQAVWEAYKGNDPMRDPVTLQESRSFLQDIGVNRIADAVEGIDSLARRARESITRPTGLARDGGRDVDGWGYTRLDLSQELTTRLVRDRPDGISVNDVLLSALHLAMADWNDRHGKVTGRLSVMMPVNLRPQEWFHQVMAMYSMFESVRSGRGDRRDAADLLEHVAWQTTRIKERDRAAALYKALAMLPDEIPIGLRQELPELLRGPGMRLTDTIILTNLGNIPTYPSVGTDTEERPFFTPPSWEGTPVGLGVASLDGRVRIFGRYLRTQFDQDGADRFMSTYATHIEQLVERLAAMEEL
ncbi:hypothetical protein [Haloglomus litoreum]|uniref:hypothetical protein n=1 Tax=Haloglomus litoreum TaxID=3034026 RepID=UPI0023E83A19|nr:hypothetical protein [Haloglomus sp. DT116]